MRLHQRRLRPHESFDLQGLPVTRPSRIASDLLYDREDPGAVAYVVADAILGPHDQPGTFADPLAPHAAQFGLRPRDGIALLRCLLDLVNDPNTSRWMEEARVHVAATGSREADVHIPAVATGEGRTT